MLSKYWGTEEAYKNGYEQGQKDANQHSHWVEFKYDVNGKTDFAFKCPVCGNVEGFDDCNYCSNCGVKMDEKSEKIPDTKCKLCSISLTGLEKDCLWLAKGSKCKHDISYEENKIVYHGHWNPGEDEDYLGCSVCGYQLFKVFLNQDELKYCPSCGSALDIGPKLI